jgi:quinol monooxygenase YgiN
MITRIVKMTFAEDRVGEFFPVFDEIKEKIKSFNGCRKLMLLRDKNHPNIIFTYSEWEDDADLQAYRNSPFFADTWKRTKKLFSAKAEAWTVEEVVI